MLYDCLTSFNCLFLFNIIDMQKLYSAKFLNIHKILFFNISIVRVYER